jgi:glycosyltransferase involved in cell wall biosynthesis
MMPLVSVIIPAYNRPRMLKDAVTSAVAQTLQDQEIIIVLNGATTETSIVAREFIGDPRISVVEMARSKLPAARNFGISHARGPWIAFLDDDDIWLPTKLEIQLAAAAETGADLVTCSFSIFNVSGEIPHPGLTPRPADLTFAEALMLGNYVSGGSAAIVKAAAIRSLGGFDERLEGNEDWDMWRRLSWDHKIFCVDKALVKYRRHGENMTEDLRVMLQGNIMHFAKLLRDTPPKLSHMLPAAQRQFYNSLTQNLTAQGILPAQLATGRLAKFLRARSGWIRSVSNRWARLGGRPA